MEYEQIRKLIDDMGNSRLDSLNVEFPDGIRISMTKNKNSVVNNKEIERRNMINNDITVISNESSNTKADNTSEEKYYLIKSPMVGTFYSRSSPNKEPFVKVGDIVKKGQPLCIVEAMKLMNEIEAECDGEIVEVVMCDEQMVEYGQTLFKIKEV